jgi:Na+/proline symporter
MFISSLGGAGGYMAQRYFAARSEKEADCMSILWIILLASRWSFIVFIALNGIYYGNGYVGGHDIKDP